jgi:hypothetical protein
LFRSAMSVHASAPVPRCSFLEVQGYMLSKLNLRVHFEECALLWSEVGLSTDDDQFDTVAKVGIRAERLALVSSMRVFRVNKQSDGPGTSASSQLRCRQAPTGRSFDKFLPAASRAVTIGHRSTPLGRKAAESGPRAGPSGLKHSAPLWGRVFACREAGCTWGFDSEFKRASSTNGNTRVNSRTHASFASGHSRSRSVVARFPV